MRFSAVDEIKIHFGFKNDAELADFLEKTRQTLSNWKTRNSFDAELLYSKCTPLNPAWLLIGDGTMLQKDSADVLPLKLLLIMAVSQS